MEGKSKSKSPAPAGKLFMFVTFTCNYVILSELEE